MTNDGKQQSVLVLTGCLAYLKQKHRQVLRAKSFSGGLAGGGSFDKRKDKVLLCSNAINFNSLCLDEEEQKL